MVKNKFGFIPKNSYITKNRLIFSNIYMYTEEYNSLERRINVLESDLKVSLSKQAEKQDEMISVLTDIRIDLQQLRQVEKNEEKIDRLEEKINNQERMYNKIFGAISLLVFLVPVLFEIFIR